MSVFFNPREIFEMAVQIERNGKRFYHEAANTVKDNRLRRELAQLSATEENLEAVLLDLLRGVAMDAFGAEWYNPEGEAALSSFPPHTPNPIPHTRFGLRLCCAGFLKEAL